MAKRVTCGEAVVSLLEQYGVDTVFGIPGVHTLDLYRGLARSKIRHVLTRHEQGAAFMADGYARVSGRPGVCFVITGPGVTNAATAMGQAFADSVPVLVISSVNESHTLGKGWGCLHEITDQRAVSAPLTAFSATPLGPEELPELIGQAFSVFHSRRPRPVHIAIPTDVLAMPAWDDWACRAAASRPGPDPVAINRAAELLASAEDPVIYVGGGALAGREGIIGIAERLAAPVISSTAGKGIVPDSHPLCLGASIVQHATRELFCQAGAILAAGTELAETDTMVERLDLQGKVIRIDIDPAKMNDLYPAEIGIQSDAGPAIEALRQALEGRQVAGDRSAAQARVAKVREANKASLTGPERRHQKVWRVLRQALPEDAAVIGDTTQIVYSGAFTFPVEKPRCWIYAAGFCTLGSAMPMAIGGKLAAPDRPIIAVVGDGGFMFTVQDLMTAVEQRLALPIIIWNNRGLRQISDDMDARGIPRVGVELVNPDFVALAESFGCAGVRPDSADELASAVKGALNVDAPTLIEVCQGATWLA